MHRQIVILGGSHAGAQAAASLRDEGYDGKLVLVSAEPHIPYHRPPLSKAYLKSDAAPQELRPESFYSGRNVELELGVTAERIDLKGGRIELAGGRTVAFDGLVYATGSRVRRLDIPGSGLSGIHYLKTLDDAVALKAALSKAERVVVVGGGFIGLEVAATACLLGCEVTVLELADRLMGRAVAPEISGHFLNAHRTRGADIRLNTGIASFNGSSGRLESIETATGETIGADLAVVGVGVIANDELAGEAGLETANGVVVSAELATSDPRIVAAGDCVRFVHAASGHSVRLESVQNANDQARMATKTLLGKGAPYSDTPWFWSDQGDDKLQMAGLAFDVDRRVVRGTAGEGKFSVFHYAGEQLVSVDSVNAPGDHMLARRMLAAGVSPKPEEAADLSADLKSMVMAAR
ncbi:MAG: FAD-dependent oxidoreductase [Rhodobiaceae bacterium]|nr:FAD-dependent oxidoreductase [Rhodobiaceae bacterium]MCC0012381.1 FAD-dependent oxidoreductase [Rhodobiaceae bacterium]